MDINQLFNVRAAALSENVSLAARNMGMTQPALSRIISGLEDELGVKIFDREGRKLILNKYGEIVLHHSDNILDLMTDAKLSLGDLCGRDTNELRLGSTFTPKKPDWIMELVTDYGRIYPNLNIRYEVKTIRKCQLDIMSDDMDIVIAPPDIQNEKIEWKYMFTEPLGVLMSEDHPLAQKECVSIHDLSGERFICGNGNSDEYELLVSYCAREGIKPQIHTMADFPEFTLAQLHSGKAVEIIMAGYFPDSGRDRSAYDGLVVRRIIEKSWCIETGIGYLKDRYISERKRNFISYITDRIAAKKSS